MKWLNGVFARSVGSVSLSDHTPNGSPRVLEILNQKGNRLWQTVRPFLHRGRNGSNFSIAPVVLFHFLQPQSVIQNVLRPFFAISPIPPGTGSRFLGIIAPLCVVFLLGGLHLRHTNKQLQLIFKNIARLSELLRVLQL